MAETVIPRGDGKAKAFEAYLADSGGLISTNEGKFNARFREGRHKGKTYNKVLEEFERRWETASPAIKDRYAKRAASEVVLSPSELERQGLVQATGAPATTVRQATAPVAPRTKPAAKAPVAPVVKPAAPSAPKAPASPVQQSPAPATPPVAPVVPAAPVIPQQQATAAPVAVAPAAPAQPAAPAVVPVQAAAPATVAAAPFSPAAPAPNTALNPNAQSPIGRWATNAVNFGAALGNELSSAVAYPFLSPADHAAQAAKNQAALNARFDDQAARNAPIVLPPSATPAARPGTVAAASPTATAVPTPAENLKAAGGDMSKLPTDERIRAERGITSEQDRTMRADGGKVDNLTKAPRGEYTRAATAPAPTGRPEIAPTTQFVGKDGKPMKINRLTGLPMGFSNDGVLPVNADAAMAQRASEHKGRVAESTVLGQKAFDSAPRATVVQQTPVSRPVSAIDASYDKAVADAARTKAAFAEGERKQEAMKQAAVGEMSPELKAEFGGKMTVAPDGSATYSGVFDRKQAEAAGLASPATVIPGADKNFPVSKPSFATVRRR